VTRTRLAFLECQFEALGLDRPAARARAGMAYALYVGLGDLRRAAPQAPMPEPEVASIIELVVDTPAAALDLAPYPAPSGSSSASATPPCRSARHLEPLADHRPGRPASIRRRPC
jgi:hypothetical protein